MLNFFIFISFSSKDPLRLAELFKEGSLDDKQAYIAPTNEAVPLGKVDWQYFDASGSFDPPHLGHTSVRLPFKEKPEDGEVLPEVFIAPVGFKVSGFVAFGK